MKLKIYRYLALAIAYSVYANTTFAADSIKTQSRLSGIDFANNDLSVRAEDDFFRYVNGTWLKNTEIPIEKPSISAYIELNEATIPDLSAIIEDLSKSKNKPGSDQQKIIDLYSSFMDTAHIQSLGVKPLQAELLKVDSIIDKNQIPVLIAWMNKTSISAPYNFVIRQDSKNASKYAMELQQSGLGMPNRDYYLKDRDLTLQGIRKKYISHVEKMLALAGDKEAEKHAVDILALETGLAKVQWDKIELRNPIKAYNKVEINNLDSLMPGYNWDSYFKNLNIKDKIDSVIVGQPSYFNGFNKLLQEITLDTWKIYFKWHIIRSAASQLPKEFGDEYFAFNVTSLRGLSTEEPRWKHGIRLVDSGMGESLGKMYADRYFPIESKVKVEKLVNNLLLAYKQSVDTLDWMDDKTRKEAQEKLATFLPKIGYPKKWSNYSELVIKKGDPLGNLRNIRDFASQRELHKLGKPVDRDEWRMMPQTANAYYNPALNEIVVPAAILRLPFFNPNADDAVNYGSIGAIIGRQISYGFDAQGSHYDSSGNFRDWWTKEVRSKFAAKEAALIKQYSAFSPVPGYKVNGELTLGENIADNSGLSMAYKAYKLSLAGQPAPIIDGLSGDQRFFIGFAQTWRSKIRENSLIRQLETDFRAPGEIRANGTLRNMPGFYDAYKLKEGDKMFLTPAERVSIW